ncbi:HAMP domain-containing histidine kinase [candidate division KSB1 bacterium]|nr:HAMP domain-containing histidine kinase [candidate division KSB1 bacterium]
MYEANLHDIIRTSIDIFRNSVDEKIVFHKRFGQIPDIRCHPDHLKRLFLMLFKHAARSHSRRVTIRTVSDKDHVTISVIDDGEGIPEKDLDRIFDADDELNFMSISEFYRCDQIVREHHGSLRVGSKVGEGTVVTICM